MGQKVHPIGIRLGIVKDWTSKWYADSKDYASYLYTDLKVREFLRKKLAAASVSSIHIERPANNARITIHTARPGIVIGKKGEDRSEEHTSELQSPDPHVCRLLLEKKKRQASAVGNRCKNGANGQ